MNVRYPFETAKSHINLICKVYPFDFSNKHDPIDQKHNSKGILPLNLLPFNKIEVYTNGFN